MDRFSIGASAVACFLAWVAGGGHAKAGPDLEFVVDDIVLPDDSDAQQPTLPMAYPRTDRAFFVDFTSSYGEGDAIKSAVMQVMAQIWQPYGVMITDQPAPANMQTQPCKVGASYNSRGTMDCADARATDPTCTAQHSADNGKSPTRQANTISEEIGHTLGLDHVADINDPMDGGWRSEATEFQDRCIPFTGGTVCDQAHATFCPAGGQNGHREMLFVFGPRVVDGGPPAADISYPPDGATFPASTQLTVYATARAAEGVPQVELLVNGESNMTLTQPSFKFMIMLPEGTHDLVVRATDGNGGQSDSENHRVVVGAGGAPPPSMPPATSGGATGVPAPPDPGGATDGGSGTSGAMLPGPADGMPGATSGVVPVGAGALPPGTVEDVGCECSANGRGPYGFGAALLLVAAGFGRTSRHPKRRKSRREEAILQRSRLCGELMVEDALPVEAEQS